MADMAGPAGGNRGGGGESSSSVGLSSTALLRVTRELKEVTRDPPNVLLGLKMDAGGSAPSRADETIDKDGRSVHRRGEVGAGNTVARTDEDAASGLMLLVIRGPDGSSYANGRYVVKLALNHDHPFQPPRSVSFLTPNGRFQTNASICIAGLTSHHPEKWSGVLTLEKIVRSLSAFMDTEYDYGIGGIQSTQDCIRTLAQNSDAYNERKGLYKDMVWMKDTRRKTNDVDDENKDVAAGKDTNDNTMVERGEGEDDIRMESEGTPGKRKREAKDEGDSESGLQELIDEQLAYTYDSESELDQYSVGTAGDEAGADGEQSSGKDDDDDDDDVWVQKSACGAMRMSEGGGES